MNARRLTFGFTSSQSAKIIDDLRQSQAKLEGRNEMKKVVNTVSAMELVERMAQATSEEEREALRAQLRSLSTWDLVIGLSDALTRKPEGGAR